MIFYEKGPRRDRQIAEAVDPMARDGLRHLYRWEGEIVAGGAACSKCGEPLAFPVVYWHCLEDSDSGADVTLRMHPECAADLAGGMSRDARKLGVA